MKKAPPYPAVLFSLATRVCLALGHDLLHAAIQRHQVGFYRQLRVFGQNLFAQRHQGFGVSLRFFFRHFAKVLAQHHFVGAAVAVVENHHLVNVVQADRHVQMLPERLVPGRKFVGYRPQRRAGQHDMVVLVFHATRGHEGFGFIYQAVVHTR